MLPVGDRLDIDGQLLPQLALGNAFVDRVPEFREQLGRVGVDQFRGSDLTAYHALETSRVLRVFQIK